MKPKFSIRYKFLFVMSLLLSACVGLYLVLAVRVFKTDKTELVFDLNKSQVTNLASDVENQFRAISEKLELFALLSQQPESARLVLDELLNQESDVVWVSMFRGKGGVAGREKHYLNETFLKTYAIEESWFEADLTGQRPIPVEKIRLNGEEIWNATVPKGPPLFGYGRSVVRETEAGVPVEHLTVVAYIRADRILKALSLVRSNQIFIVNDAGHVLAHPDSEQMSAAVNQSQHPLVERALKDSVKVMVSRFEKAGDEYLGAFARSFKGKILVVAEVPAAQAFAAVGELMRRSLLFGSIVVTLAFMVAILLSRSLTKPLNTLMEGMSKVGEGDLETQINVKSRDEISVLAARFNRMITDLRTSRRQLEEINQSLEAKVKERTRQLEEQNQAVKEAQEALLRTTRLAAVGEIAGRAAHEVLNPLTSLMTRVQKIQRRMSEKFAQDTQLLGEMHGAWTRDYQAGGFEKVVDGWKTPSQVLQGKTMWDEDLENIGHIKSSVETEAKEIASDASFLLDQSSRINRIVSGMRSLSVVKAHAHPHNGPQLLHDCVNIMADLYGQYGVEIKESHDVKDAIVHVDRDEFIQSVTNLLRNSLQAVNAVPNKRPDQGLVLIHSYIENGQFVADIEDNGVGIAGDDKQKLFEKQFSTKAPEEGTGLGLSISRRFMRAFGGDIVFVESKPLYSTVFRITLPQSKSGEVAA